MRPRYLKATKKDTENLKDRQTGTRRGFVGPTKPVETRKPNNRHNVIWNPISQNPDYPFKVIRNLVPNRFQIQCMRGLTVPELLQPQMGKFT